MRDKSITSQGVPCLLGIIARFDMNNQYPLGQQTSFIGEMMASSRSLDIPVALFHPEELIKCWNENVVPGFRLSLKQCLVLQQEQFEFPQVIYDRFYSRITGFDKETEDIRIKLKSRCFFVNPHNFARAVTDKAVFNQKMKEYSIPSPAVLHPSINRIEDLRETLKGRSSIIIKPVFGRMGYGITRIVKTRRGFDVEESHRKIHCSTDSEILGCLQEICRQNGLRLPDLMIQETIIIPRSSGRWFDIRSIVQRIDGGDIIITGTGARISSGSMAVPNLDKGGVAFDLERWLLSLNLNAEEIIPEIDGLSRRTMQKFEEEYGLIGEIGIDFLLDQAGRVWVVEVNSKPGRGLFTRLSQGFGLTDEIRGKYLKIRKASVENPIRYGRWLSSTGDEREKR
jgi:glutathione synthase/RimK-type ligase-like ATP-grasp enzyme